MLRHLRLIVVLAGRGLLELSRMPGILAVIFVPGIVMYTIFTLMFSGGGDGESEAMPAPTVAIVDLDQSPASRRLVEALGQTALHLQTVDVAGRPFDLATAQANVRSRHADAALVIPPGGAIPLEPNAPPLQLFADETQPMARAMIAGMVQMAAGITLMGAFENLLELATGRSPAPSPHPGVAQEPTAPRAGRQDLLRVEHLGIGRRQNRHPLPRSLIYLAGLVPMFLLFNANGAANAMLEELHSGATRRILVAPVSAGDYLAGQLVMSMFMSLAQCAAMYVFARVVFRAPIFAHPGGLLVLTVAITFATTGFGMFMGSLSRSAEQLNSIGMVVILAMSALGGSMFPRAFMPAWIKPLGLFTINGWAYDGFVDLIRGEGLAAMAAELAVLAACGLVLTTTASMIMHRRLRG